jgi:hypothetical protein
MKRLLLSGLLVLLAVTPARADNATQVAAALRSSPVYQAAGLDLVDVGKLTSKLSGTNPRVVVAVLGTAAAGSGAEAHQRAVDIGKALGESDAVVLVITASKHLGSAEGSGAAARGVDAKGALDAELSDFHGKDFDKDNLTVFATSFADRIANQVSTSASGTNDGGGQGQTSSSGAGRGAWLLGGLLVVGGGAAALAVSSSRARRKRLNEGLRAEVEQLYERLGADVLNLDAGDNKVAQQALADASERYSACGGQLASADGPAEFAAARRTAVEGLTASRSARVALGLDPGPEVPLVPGTGPQLASDQQVTVAGQAYDGSPEYAPGRPHYYGGGYVGGQHVPGGWYSGNFWEPFLLGSILTGGFGGGFGGGGGGFERGYDEGYQAGQDSGAGGGGDWGGGGDSGGGGDWGGGDSGGGGGGDW